MKGKKGQVEGGLKIGIVLIITGILIVVLLLVFKGLIDGGFK